MVRKSYTLDNLGFKGLIEYYFYRGWIIQLIPPHKDIKYWIWKEIPYDIKAKEKDSFWNEGFWWEGYESKEETMKLAEAFVDDAQRRMQYEYE